MLTHSQARALFEQLQREGTPYTALDGPQVLEAVAGQQLRHDYRRYQMLLRASAARGAARIMIGLNRYHAAHGRYPVDLFELAPDFITDVPLDPFCQGPYGYRTESDCDFVLYSCAADGEDDGGRITSVNWEWRVPRADVHFDLVYTFPRAKPPEEPALQPIPGGSPADSGSRP